MASLNNPGDDDVLDSNIQQPNVTLDPVTAGNGTAAKWHMKKVLDVFANAQDKKNTYRYRDILCTQQLRVLKLYPGTTGSRLICSLVPQAFDDTTTLPKVAATGTQGYTALSYYWGSEEPSHPLFIFKDDEEYVNWKKNVRSTPLLQFMTQNLSKLLIRTNLRDALEQLRSPTEDVVLWVDAICINQKNDMERSAQVARMHDVYTQAHRVQIWLGKPSDKMQNEKVFSFLNRILDMKNLEEVVKKLEQKSDDWEEERENIRATIELMKAKWFSRRWIIQELALATNAYVCRGEEVMAWSDFADAIALFMTKYDQVRRSAFRTLPDYSMSRSSFRTEDHQIRSLDARGLGAYALVTVTSDLFRRSNEGMVVQRLLSLEVLVSSMLLAFEATDPKDTVFAVLQIAKDLQVNSHAVRFQQRGWRVQILPIIPYILWKLYDHIVLPTDSTTTQISNINTALSTRSNFVIVLECCRVTLSLLLILLVWRTFLDLFSSGLSTILTGRSTTKELLDKRIEANYRKCLTDVCADFIEYCIEKSNSLDILCRHWAPESKHLHNNSVGTPPHVDMPSWILPITGDAFGGPAQTLKGRVNGDSFVRGTERGSHYSASGDSLPSYKFGRIKILMEDVAEEEKVEPDPDGYTKIPESSKKEYPSRFDGTLRVKGFQLGSIERTAPVVGGVITRAALELCGWEPGSGTDLRDQVWRILVANRGPNGTNPPNWYRRTCISCLEWYEDQPENTFNTRTLKNYASTPEGKIAFLDRVQQVVWGRNVICIVNEQDPSVNFVGIAPPESQRSDIVCILYGCSVPVVLRPQRKGGYNFIGGCYVHGVMDGEAVDPAKRASRSKDEWFELK